MASPVMTSGVSPGDAGQGTPGRRHSKGEGLEVGPRLACRRSGEEAGVERGRGRRWSQGVTGVEGEIGHHNSGQVTSLRRLERLPRMIMTMTPADSILCAGRHVSASPVGPSVLTAAQQKIGALLNPKI